MFCPKCHSILIPKQEQRKVSLTCSCGYKAKCDNKETTKIRDCIKRDVHKIEIVEKNHALEVLPLTDAECPKCANKKARYWTLQTRAGDEPETKFLKCEKCRHTWRDYN